MKEAMPVIERFSLVSSKMQKRSCQGEELPIRNQVWGRDTVFYFNVWAE